MTKSILSLSCFILISFFTFGSNAPALVQKAFEQKFPKATSVKWDKESVNNYEATFKQNGIEYSANFNNSGEWLETESPFTFNQLPEKVKTSFNTSHKDAKVKSVSIIETSKQGTIYEVEFKEGVKTVELFYKADGTKTKE